MSDKYILLKYKDGVRTIILNRPERKNALCMTMYETLTRVLTQDAVDDNIVVTIVTGTGSYFSSGNDLKSAMTDNSPASDRLDIVKDMLKSIINYPKLLIAVVNGPAVGIGATMSALCDIVYATDNAVFDTPFLKMGLCVEGASSFTFPFILGKSKASEVLYLNEKLGAQKAYQYGLVSKVIPQHELDDFINDLHKHGSISTNSITVNKNLVMNNFRMILCECIDREMKQLQECIVSEEFSNAVVQFLSKKSKL